MKKDDVYILEDRGLLYLNGEDVKEFLQNLVTNDIEKVTNKMSCFAALLTPQGKYLFDFLIIKHKSGYFLDCEKKNIDQLYIKLNLYKLRSKVEILTPFSDNIFIASNAGEDLTSSVSGLKVKPRIVIFLFFNVPKIDSDNNTILFGLSAFISNIALSKGV